MRAKSGLDVPETVLEGDLGIENGDILLPYRKGFHVPVVPIVFRDFFKLISRTKL